MTCLEQLAAALITIERVMRSNVTNALPGDDNTGGESVFGIIFCGDCPGLRQRTLIAHLSQIIRSVSL